MAVPAQALVVADGDVDRSLLDTLAGAADTLLIAADGGARRVLEAGLVPDVVVGDFDSLPPAERHRLEASGVELRVAAPDKDESDMELCLLAAIASGTRRIVVLGALGLVRPEHSVANLLLLADPRLDGLEVTLAGRGSRIFRAGMAAGPGAVEIAGEPGDLVSLFPLGDAVEGVSTHGLRFALADETLLLGPSRGLSNELLGPTAQVSSRRGRLLVIHTDRSMADAPPTGGD
jgi:thiamine pyrophosphokinase